MKEAWKFLGFREERKLYRQLDCEIEFQLDQPAVPIVNPIRWQLIENRAMLLDVGFVQTDRWDSDRSAAVARNA